MNSMNDNERTDWYRRKMKGEATKKAAAYRAEKDHFLLKIRFHCIKQKTRLPPEIKSGFSAPVLNYGF